ncbi:Cas9 inhibitor AcrIIA9 family protein [Streptococcus salivarius]|uniref:Cas9 inhibitor AcrIIA9 family protein n=1 Tax=Streptococcus salivarius TaxID=1304 RepID=UPI00352F2041
MTMEINDFDRFMAVSHFDDEMAEAHTPTEDAIHNWIVDHQEDDELIAGILKHLDRTIKDAMAYCIRKASKSDYREGQGAMVDDDTVFSWVKEYFISDEVEIGSVFGRMTTDKAGMKPKKAKAEQLDLFSDLSVEEGEF